MKRLRRHGFALTAAALVSFIVVVGAWLVVFALPDLQNAAAAPGASVGASPTPNAGPIGMDWLTLPPNADCAACHSTGGGIGTRAVPALAHPLEGWTNCTACHSDDRLVQTAPGHSGIHASDCLMCHKVAPSDLPAPLSRPHRDLQNVACLSCHGSTAPLPADMSHRTQSVCWLCHRLPQVEPPLPTHPLTAGEKDCLTCHVAGKAGALPDDHATRSALECMLCHEPRDMAPTPAATSIPLPSPGQISAVPAVAITAVGWWTEYSPRP